MDKYEYTVKADKIKQLAGRGDYATAARIASGIDWSRVQDVRSLILAADVFENNGDLDAAKEVLLTAYDQVPIGKGMLYRLTEICIDQGKIGEAENYYDAYCKAAPHDISRYVLRYDIACARHESLERRISILEKLNEIEVDEEMGYELARLYHKAGRGRDCVRMCDQVILWFGDGEFVDMARDLKAQYSGAVAEAERRKEEDNENRRKRIESLEAEIADHSDLWEDPSTESKTIGDMLDEESGTAFDDEDDEYEDIEESSAEAEPYDEETYEEEEYSEDISDDNADESDSEYADEYEEDAPYEEPEDTSSEDFGDTAEILNISDFINAGNAHTKGPQLETFSWMDTDPTDGGGVGQMIWERLKDAEREAAFQPDPQPEREEREEAASSADDFSRSLEDELSEEVQAFDDEDNTSDYKLAPDITADVPGDSMSSGFIMEETEDLEESELDASERDEYDEAFDSETAETVPASEREMEVLECGVAIPVKAGQLPPSLEARLISRKFFDERGLALPEDQLPSDLDDTRKLNLPWTYEEHTKKLDELKDIRNMYERSDEKSSKTDASDDVNVPEPAAPFPDSEYLDIRAVQEAADAKEASDKAASEADMAEQYGEPMKDFVVILVEVSDEEKSISRAMEMIHDTHESMQTEMIQVAKVTGSKINARGMGVCLDRLRGRDLIILEAGDLDTDPVLDLLDEIDDPQDNGVIILVDTPERLRELVDDNPELAEMGIYEQESGQTVLPFLETITSRPAAVEEEEPADEAEEVHADETSASDASNASDEPEEVPSDEAESSEDDEYADYVDDDQLAEAFAAGSKLYEELINMSQLLPDIHDTLVDGTAEAAEAESDDAEEPSDEEEPETSEEMEASEDTETSEEPEASEEPETSEELETSEEPETTEEPEDDDFLPDEESFLPSEYEDEAEDEAETEAEPESEPEDEMESGSEGEMEPEADMEADSEPEYEPEDDQSMSIDDQMAMAFGGFGDEEEAEPSGHDDIAGFTSALAEELARMAAEDAAAEAEPDEEETAGDEDYIPEEPAYEPYDEPEDTASDEEEYTEEGYTDSDEEEFIDSEEEYDDYDDYGDPDYDEGYDVDDESAFDAVNDFVIYAEDYAASMDCVIEETAMLEIQACAEDMLQDGEDLSLDAARTMVDKAVEQAEKTSIKSIFSKKYDKQGRLILKEQHFNLH